MRHWRLLLILIALVSFGIALSYPVMYRLAEHSNNTELGDLSAMRSKKLNELGETRRAADAMDKGDDDGKVPEEAPDPGTQTAGGASQAVPQTAEGQAPQAGEGQIPQTAEGQSGQLPEGQSPQTAEGQTSQSGGQTYGSQRGDEAALPQGEVYELTPEPTPTPSPSPTPGLMDLLLDYAPGETVPPYLLQATPTPAPTPVPTPTINRYLRPDAKAYPNKEKVRLDVTKILPELREIYELNHDLVGWINIPGTIIDYPVVQNPDHEYYLHRDFYGNKNSNGQIILDEKCDPWTPSYNLIISGHRMNNGSMFAGLAKYQARKYWEEHKLVHFDTLMARRDYVVFAAFYSADYDAHEEGFRYNADIQYRLDADQWLEEIRKNQIYDTGIDVQFGDEFITLTTCNYTRRNGRFVLVCRRLREGEKLE